MSRRRKSDINGVFDMLFELTNLFWQVGAVVTAALLFLSFIAYRWAVDQNAAAESSALLAPIIENIGLVFYLLPLMLVALACIFGAKTYGVYCKGEV